MFREGIRWENPATISQPFGEIKDGIIGGFLDLERKYRDITTLSQQLKRSQFRYLSREVDRHILTGLLYTPVAILPQTEEVVILGNNLAARTREVQRKSIHPSTQVVHFEN